MKLINLFIIFSLAIPAFAQSEATDSMQVKRLSLVKDSLNNQITTLKGLYKESSLQEQKLQSQINALIKEKETLTANHSKEVERLKASNDSLQKRFVSMASYFLYVPYDSVSVNAIAIPAFNNIKGTTVYENYKLRLDMLTHYGEDTRTLSNFFTEASKELKWQKIDSGFRNKAAENLQRLSQLPLYSRYKSFEGWQKTHLGNIILEVEKVLKNPKMETTITQLTSIQEKLTK